MLDAAATHLATLSIGESNCDSSESPAAAAEQTGDTSSDAPDQSPPPPLPEKLPFPLEISPLHPSPPLVEEPIGAHACTILMLHGWTNNAHTFREKTHGFVRKLRAAGARLVYVSAPYHVPKSAAGDRDNARGWWYYRDLSDIPGADVSDPIARFKRQYHGWEASRSYIASLWSSHGPFTGLVGFSQGAVLVHQMLREVEGWRRSGGTVPPDCGPIAAQPPRFGIMVCGFAARYGPPLPPVDDSNSNCSAPPFIGGPGWPHALHLPLPHGPEPLLLTPSMHCIGEGDTTVPPYLQHELAACFADPVVCPSDKGHTMPQRAGELSAIVAFVKKHSGGS